MLVLTRTRFGALIRLLIWLAIVAGFYRVLLTEQPQILVQAQPARWLLVLVAGSGVQLPNCWHHVELVSLLSRVLSRSWQS